MTTIVLVGAGALGSHAALLCRNLGARLVAVDFDRVEQKNVLAQLHPKATVGKNKAEALRQTLLLFGARVDAVPHRLVAENADALLGPADLVVDAVDNGATRRLISSWVRRHGKPCVHGALSADGTFGRVVWDEVFTVDDEDAGRATCEDGRQLPFVALTASVLASAVQAFVERGERRSVQLTSCGIVLLDLK